MQIVIIDKLIFKWENSQGIKILKKIMKKLNFQIEDELDIILKDKKVVIELLKNNIPTYNLNELISKIPNNYKTKEEW